MVRYSVQKYQKDETLFKQGERGMEAFIIKSGAVEIQTWQDNRKIVLATLTEGAVLGEMALLLRDHCRTATAVVLEESEIISFDKRLLDSHLESSSSVVRALLNGLVDRLRKTTQQLLNPEGLIISVCRILHLLSLHSEGPFRYDETIDALKRALRVEERAVLDSLEMLRDVNLIQILERKGQKGILVTDPDTLMSRVVKIHQRLQGN